MKLAIIGVGSQGFKYAKMIESEVNGLEVSALVRINDERKEYFKNTNIKIYNEVDNLLTDIDNKIIQIDSFLITTPHKSHKRIAMAALRRGINVLLEKPISCILSEALELNECFNEAKKVYPNLLFGVIYQNRLLPSNKYLKDIIESNKYGKVLGVNIINNGFFRPHAYFTSSKWRGSYSTEGGALLINQASHSLDLIYYLFGLPKSLYSSNLTQVHHIDAEDSVSAILKYDNFNINYTASLNDPFNTNLFDVIFENAKVSISKDKIYLYELDKDYNSYLSEETNLFIKPKYSIKEIKLESIDPYKELFNNFAKAQVISGVEAMYSLYMINAMALSSFESREIKLLLDKDYLSTFNNAYLNHLIELSLKEIKK